MTEPLGNGSGTVSKDLQGVSTARETFAFAIRTLVECAAAIGVEGGKREVLPEHGFALRVASLP